MSGKKVVDIFSDQMHKDVVKARKLAQALATLIGPELLKEELIISILAMNMLHARVIVSAEGISNPERIANDASQFLKEEIISQWKILRGPKDS